MRKTIFPIVAGIGILIFLVSGCEKKLVSCPTCKGVGKITQSKQEYLPYQITNHRLLDKGLLNPDYFLDVSIENKGDKDGSFKIYVDFIYTGIGKHTEESELFIRAHSTGTKTIRYDADKRADRYEIRVTPPVVVLTVESICPTCGGRGIVN